MAKILIIEDNPANLKLVTMLLRRVDHTVLGAVDAETGKLVLDIPHGGQISAKAKPGQGAMFRFSLAPAPQVMQFYRPGTA